MLLHSFLVEDQRRTHFINKKIDIKGNDGADMDEFGLSFASYTLILCYMKSLGI